MSVSVFNDLSCQSVLNIPSQELECLLPARPEDPEITADAEEVELTDFDRSQGMGGGARREAYNDSSDEEGGHHGHGVQCAHQ